MQGVSCGAYRLVEAAQVPHSLAAAAIHHIRQPWLGIQAATVLSLLPKATPLLWLMSSTPPFVSMEVTLRAQSCVHSTRFSHFPRDCWWKVNDHVHCIDMQMYNLLNYHMLVVCVLECPKVTIEIKKNLITDLIGCLSGGFLYFPVYSHAEYFKTTPSFGSILNNDLWEVYHMNYADLFSITFE